MFPTGFEVKILYNDCDGCYENVVYDDVEEYQTRKHEKKWAPGLNAHLH